MCIRDRQDGESARKRHSRRAAPEAFRIATEQTPFEVGVGLPGRVAQQGGPALIGDIALDGNFPRAAVAGACGLRSAFAFPILALTRVVGVLEFYLPRTDVPDEQLLHLMSNIGIQLGRVFERLEWRDHIEAAAESRSRLLSLLAH